MTDALLCAYLCGWIMTAIGVRLAARRLQDHQEPATHPLILSIVAGAVWPVLVIGLAEAAFVALTHEAMHEHEPMLSPVA